MFFQQYCSLTVFFILCLFLVVVFSKEETEAQEASIRMIRHILFFAIGGAIASAHCPNAVLVPFLWAIVSASISIGVFLVTRQNLPENMGIDAAEEMLEQKE